MSSKKASPAKKKAPKATQRWALGLFRSAADGGEEGFQRLALVGLRSAVRDA